LQGIWPQDDGEVFRMATASVAERKLEVYWASQPFVSPEGRMFFLNGAGATIRILGKILLPLTLAIPSHLFRRRAFFSPLPFCG